MKLGGRFQPLILVSCRNCGNTVFINGLILGCLDDNVAVYLRLSKEDNESMESNSIVNQRELIHLYISSKSELGLVDYYIDDGYSGTNFNRPGFEKILQDIKKILIA